MIECKCKTPQPNVFIAEGNFCDKCNNRIIYKQMKIPYQIRIDQDLLDKVKKSAKDNERSVNAEIRYLIKCALDK